MRPAANCVTLLWTHDSSRLQRCLPRGPRAPRGQSRSFASRSGDEARVAWASLGSLRVSLFTAGPFISSPTSNAWWVVSAGCPAARGVRQGSSRLLTAQPMRPEGGRGVDIGSRFVQRGATLAPLYRGRRKAGLGPPTVRYEHTIHDIHRAGWAGRVKQRSRTGGRWRTFCLCRSAHTHTPLNELERCAAVLVVSSS